MTRWEGFFLFVMFCAMHFTLFRSIIKYMSDEFQHIDIRLADIITSIIVSNNKSLKDVVGKGDNTLWFKCSKCGARDIVFKEQAMKWECPSCKINEEKK